MHGGGSDASAGVTRNPSVGSAAVLMGQCGCNFMFSEVTEARHGIRLLTPRAANEQVAKVLIRVMK